MPTKKDHPPAACGLRAWAARHLIAADGPHAGKRFRVAGPWAEILGAFDDPDLQQVTVRGSVQSGKTASLIAAALYFASQGRVVLIFEPDDKLRRALAKRILAWGRLCRDPRVAAAYAPARPPLEREIEGGGRLEVLSAAEHGATLMRTAEIVIIDELRAFKEDVLAGLNDRMASWGGKGRLITASSAGYEDECKTTAELEKSDNRRWQLHCPECGRDTVAAWEAFRMPKGRAPFYAMPCCGAALSTAGLRRAVAAGRWQAIQTPLVVGTRGYHMDAFLSPFETLGSIERAWRRAMAHQKLTTSNAEIIDFQCSRLALPFRPESSGGVTPEGIAASCRADYQVDQVPEGASVLIAACDVQDNRLECEISAWGLHEVETEGESQTMGAAQVSEYRGLRHAGKWWKLRRWAMSYHRLRGDPGQPEVWDELAEIAERPIPHALGPRLRPCITGVDVGGHYGPAVSEFVRTRGDGYQCLKGLGQNRFGSSLARRSVTVDSLEQYGPSGLLLVCANSGKNQVFSMLRQSCAGADPRPLVWPQDTGAYGPEEFEGICSETLSRVIDKRTGRTRLQWKKTRRENEALDVLVYSLAMATFLGPAFMQREADAIRQFSERKVA